jgi:hypothetical protein
MILWEVKRKEGILGVYLPNKDASDAAQGHGTNTIVLRDVLSSLNSIEFKLISNGGTLIEAKCPIMSDFLSWSWGVPIFSGRAKLLAIRHGCKDDEFLECRFQSNPEDVFFLHLPVKSYDIVDVAKSTFLVNFSAPPGMPPRPHGIQTLKTKPLSPEPLPACFRASVPGHHGQVFSELFAINNFKLAWEQSRFMGVSFRQLV